MFDLFLPAALREVIQNRLAPLFQYFTHLSGKIQIRFKTKGAGDVVEKGAFDGDGVDDMLAEKSAVEFLGYPDGIIQRRRGMFRAVERKQNGLDHRLPPVFRAITKGCSPCAPIAPCYSLLLGCDTCSVC